jgi:hypothetical protein
MAEFGITDVESSGYATRILFIMKLWKKNSGNISCRTGLLE